MPNCKKSHCLKTAFLQSPAEGLYFSSPPTVIGIYQTASNVRREVPQIIGSIRASMAFQVKSWINKDKMEALEQSAAERVFSWLDAHAPNIHVLGAGPLLGGAGGSRLPIVSFLVKHGPRFLHYNFVSAVLNDVFGIQARGGCACAGPYAHHLLGLSRENSNRIEACLIQRRSFFGPALPSKLSILY